VNTGVTFVGMVSSGTMKEFTAFGDPINVAAHLATQAGAGEILTTDATLAAAGLGDGELERRRLSLKGHEVDSVVFPLGSVTAA
jgi:class 3 adenylate cyclase